MRKVAQLSVVLMGAAMAFAAPALANPTPGVEIDDETGTCTAGFAVQGPGGENYLLTAGHCDEGDASQWVDAGESPLGQVSASEYDGNDRDAAAILLDPGAGPPVTSVAGVYPVRDVLRPDQILLGMPLCKVGATTGETCGVVTGIDGNMVEANVFSLEGDSGSPAFVKNPDGTVSAVGLLSGSPYGDDYTTYFSMVDPLLAEWGLHLP